MTESSTATAQGGERINPRARIRRRAGLKLGKESRKRGREWHCQKAHAKEMPNKNSATFQKPRAGSHKTEQGTSHNPRR